MNSTPNRRTVLKFAATGTAALVVQPGVAALADEGSPASHTLLTDPFQQAPSRDRCTIVWFTEWRPRAGMVVVGAGVDDLGAAIAPIPPQVFLRRLFTTARGVRQFTARTRALSRMFEDEESRIEGRRYSSLTRRQIWRHEAVVSGLSSTPRPYRIASLGPDGWVVSATFTVRSAPSARESQLILLTSDHQLKRMVPANIEMVGQVSGGALTGVFVAGDLVNVPDRASEWFGSQAGPAFFPSLQGKADTTIAGRRWVGAPLIQNVPLYTAIGNHEVMGRQTSATLGTQFNDPHPVSVAEQRYEQVRGSVNPTGDPRVRRDWITGNSFNSTSYDEMFTLPTSADGGSRYYATTVGDIRLIVLHATLIWRPPGLTPDVRGKFREADADLGNPERWGYGQHIFEPIARGSRQYDWLRRELRSTATQAARYRVVMFHHPVHGLGDNSAPAFTDPVAEVRRDPSTGKVLGVRYDYPLDQDHLLRDVEPLLSDHDVHLVLNGHSHVWNRFRNASGVHFLETSNVGNTYGAYPLGGASRSLPTAEQGFPDRDYVKRGDPGNLLPVMPTRRPLSGVDGRPQPFLSSNSVTAFSLLDTSVGAVRSYYFDTDQPSSAPVLFDEFFLGGRIRSSEG